MESSDEWTVPDSNEAVSIALVSPTTGADLATTNNPFHPSYTYPIFGENETIFGYKGLQIRVLLAADNMAPCVDVSWTAKMPKQGVVEAEDVERALREHLPAKAFGQDAATFRRRIRDREHTFVPPGTKTGSFTVDGRAMDGRTGNERTLEVYRSTLSDAATRALLENMQFLVAFYIEAGTALDLDDEEWTRQRWDVFFLYERSGAGTYTFIGYSTLYRWYYFDAHNADLARVRLSQFLVLPPFQKTGLGARFYDSIMAHYIDAPFVVELTVEDPSEPFEDLRDRQDLARLRRDPDFRGLTLDAVVAGRFPGETVRRRAKMPKRQFARCMEMQLLSGINAKGKQKEKEKSEIRKFKILVKKRVYRQNVDMLAQVDRLERIDKLEQTYYAVEDEYRRILRKMNNNSSNSTKRPAEDGNAPPLDQQDARPAKKRKEA